MSQSSDSLPLLAASVLAALLATAVATLALTAVVATRLVASASASLSPGSTAAAAVAYDECQCLFLSCSRAWFLKHTATPAAVACKGQTGTMSRQRCVHSPPPPPP